MAGTTEDGTGEASAKASSEDQPGVLRDNPLFLRIAIAEVLLVAMAGVTLWQWGDTDMGNVVFAILASVAILAAIPTVLIAVSMKISDRKFR